MHGELEHFFYCPFCMEQISMVIEVFSGNQSYVEDCEVCCRPIEIKYTCEDGLISSFEADRAQ
jgi:transcription elongation factor Elf1